MTGLGVRGSVLMATFCWFWLHAVGLRTDPSEANALRAIKKDLIDPIRNLSSWDKGDPCKSKWIGVVCFNDSDRHLHVQELLLLNMNLSGNLSPEVGQLSHLEILDLMWNNLTGPIPPEIGKISSLRLLLLNGNKFSGPLPPELGDLRNLTRLQVDENKISGPIPVSFCNLTSVEHLHLNNNTIEGEIPVALSRLPKLLHLILDNNNLTGNLPPELAQLPVLRILQLDNNNFEGSKIPDPYENFPSLVKLSLRNCGVEGPVPDFSRIQQLSYLDLSRNNLTGPIPPSKLSDNMTTINLSDNHLNGSIPKSFSELPSLQLLSLGNNSVSGSIPTTIWQNKSFGTNKLQIDLRNNNFSNITGELILPRNVTLLLGQNPVCNNTSIPNVGLFCESDEQKETSTNSTNFGCHNLSCPFGFVPVSFGDCFCTAPLLIEYRLKSPSFFYFLPYIAQFKEYLAESLLLETDQLAIDSFGWEEGPRLRMRLKLFPRIAGGQTEQFNKSDVLRIRGIFTSWQFNRTDLFGPYELLKFPLVGPYAYADRPDSGISTGAWAGIMAGCVVVATVLSVTATLFVVGIRSSRSRTLSGRRLFSTISREIDGVRNFSFGELAQATDNFKSTALVGRGGYGKVYRGVLPNKTVVAVKRAEECSLQGEREFLNEIELLSRLHHRNLVSLLGYCDDEGEQMLVYEFMPNGTLREWLSASATETLNLGMRLSVALGSARGILYLHTEANPPVFHRDIKSSNILLDNKLNAKVADFGLSRLAPDLDDGDTQPSHVSTTVKGTPGYVDPEYFMTRKLTDKSDVYSLGVVFLELLTGMHPIIGGKNIVREVRTAYESGEILSVIDRRMGSSSPEKVRKLGELALRCCKERPEMRPSMAEVVRELQGIRKPDPETYTVVSSEEAYLLWGKSSSSTSLKASASQLGPPSSSVLGDELDSGVIPTIAPR